MKLVIPKEKINELMPINPVVMADFADYVKDGCIRKGSAPDRHYMQHRNQTGYTRIRQTASNLIIEWME